MRFLKQRWVLALVAAFVGAGLLYWYAKRQAAKSGATGNNPNGANTTTTTTTTAPASTLSARLAGNVTQLN